MMETIAELVTRYRTHLMEKGWPDPLLRHVWVENCPTGEVFVEELDRAIATGRIRVEMKTLPGWQTLRLTFEAMGLAWAVRGIALADRAICIYWLRFSYCSGSR